MSSKHTPGPWNHSPEVSYGWDINGDGIWIGSAHNSHTTQCRPQNGFPSQLEGEANAHLIAAAPDMQEALEAMVEEKCDYMLRNNLGFPEHQHTVKQARAALAKSRGQS